MINSIDIIAGGSTTYELCACSVPSVCFSLADNQVMGVDAFSKSGLMIGAGDIREGSNKCITAVIEGLKMYCGDYEMRARCGNKLKGVVDGDGVRRICEMMGEMELFDQYI